MSTYSDDDRQQRRHRRRVRRPVYEEDVYEASRGGARAPPQRAMDLVRANSDDSDVEEIRRDFAPGEGVYVKRRYYQDAPSYGGDTRSEGGERRHRRSRRRSDERRRNESDSDADSESDKSPPRRERRKSFVETALAGLGLGGAAAALTGNKQHDSNDGRSKNDRRGRDRSASSSGSNRSVRSTKSKRSTSKERREKFAQAAKSALAAGVIEAWRSRKEPGGLGGAGKRIATAAIGAAGINGLLDANSRNPQNNGMLKVIESTVGGLAGNRLINGPRSKSRGRRDDSNSRSPSGRREKEAKTGNAGAVTGVAAASALAAIGWQAYSTYAKRKNGQHASDDSDSDRGRGSGGGRARSKSISDRFKGMMGNMGEKLGYQEPQSNGQSRPRGGGYEENERERGHESDSSSSGIHTDTYSSDEEKKKCKKMHTKQFIIAGLATAATIHAASSVYKSVEARRVRRKKVAQGKMSVEEAQKLKSRAVLQDAASIGLAAIGIKSAYSEWREMMEQRKELREHRQTLQEKHEHRMAKMQRGEWNPSRKHGSQDGDGLGQGRIEYADDGGNGRGYANAPVRYTDGNPYGYH